MLKAEISPILQKRYPQLSFLLQLKRKQRPCLQEARQDSHKISAFVDKIKKMNPSLILIIGLGKGRYIEPLLSWLTHTSAVDIVIFEKHPEQVETFFHHPHAETILEHPQVHLRLIMEGASLEQAIEEAVQEYPSDNLCLEVLPEYEKDYKTEELSLIACRKATIASSLFNEDRFYHLLAQNLLPNLARLGRCFYADGLRGQFKDIPAIVCGAGPSLAAHIPLLKKSQTKALILAGGSTIAALTTQGVYPHLGFALDPNPEEYERLKANIHDEIPLLFGNRVFSGIFDKHQGMRGYMRTSSGGLMEKAMEDMLGLDLPPLYEGLSQEGLSVTVMCLAAAVHFGCQPIVLSGIDLAYVGGKRYAEGVVIDSTVTLEDIIQNKQVSERILCRKNRQGHKVNTSVKWIMEAATIEDFAKQHPATTIIDCIEGGLGFPTLPKKSFAHVFDRWLIKEYDLYNLVDQKIKTCPHLSNNQEEIRLFIEELWQSFLSAQHIVRKILDFLSQITADKIESIEEHALMTLYLMDLSEEKAFSYCLEPAQERIIYMLTREYRTLVTGEDKRVFIMKKWRCLEKLIEHYLRLFNGLTLVS